jgi:hypothetical protein
VPLIVGVLCAGKYSDQSSTVVNKCQQIKPGARCRTDIKTFLMMAAFARITSKQAKNNTRLYIAFKSLLLLFKTQYIPFIKVASFCKKAKRKNGAQKTTDTLSRCPDSSPSHWDSSLCDLVSQLSVNAFGGVK